MTDSDLTQLKEQLTKELSNSYIRGWSAGAKTVCKMVLKDIEEGNDLDSIVEKINTALGEAKSKGDETDES